MDAQLKCSTFTQWNINQLFKIIKSTGKWMELTISSYKEVIASIVRINGEWGWNWRIKRGGRRIRGQKREYGVGQLKLRAM